MVQASASFIPDASDHFLPDAEPFKVCTMQEPCKIQCQLPGSLPMSGNKQTEVLLASRFTSEEQPINVGSQVVMMLTEERRRPVRVRATVQWV